MKAEQSSALIGVSETHLPLFRSGMVRGVRVSTLAKLCAALDCQPADLIVYDPAEVDLTQAESDGDD